MQNMLDLLNNSTGGLMRSFFLGLLIAFFSLSSFAQNDISNCDDSQMEIVAQQMIERGYTLIETVPYEVLTYSFGPNNYWKTVHAKKMRNAEGRIAFAKCDGMVGNLPTEIQTFQGTWAYCQHSLANDPKPFCDFKYSGTAQFHLKVEGISLNPLGGGLEMTASGTYTDISADSDSFPFRSELTSILKPTSVKHISFSRGFALGATTVRFNDEGNPEAVSLQDESNPSVLVTFATTPPAEPSFALHLRDKPDKSGILIWPKSEVILNKDFSGELPVINESSFAVRLSSPVMAETTLKASTDKMDKISIPLGSPTTISVTTDLGTELIQVIN
jgi:hypothetical protein